LTALSYNGKFLGVMSLKFFFQATLSFSSLFLSVILLAGDTVGELEEYWNRVSQAVRTGDLEGYRATCHTDGVLISGKAKKSELLSQALIRWSKEFSATKAGKMQADVKFRFSGRITGKDTAHEKGIFLYSSKKKGEEWKKDYVHFEALLVKKDGEWKILMEFQKSSATQKEWESLAK
tara:strand:- start:285 stop:818 length:534 start_codon:yes stop_codon:yes gene_type:complete